MARSLTFTFTKRFTARTAGFSVGDTFVDTITFPALSGFAQWAREINALNARGKLPYCVEVQS